MPRVKRKPCFSTRHAIAYSRNIAAVFAQATPDEIREGLSWYAKARDLAGSVSSASGLDFERVAAAIAVLSPSTPWTAQERETGPFVSAILSGADPKTVKIRAYGKNKAKAVRIIRGENPADVVKGPKVSRFWRNICGDEFFATVDRHAVRVALGVHISAEECKALLSRKANYTLYEFAYRLAARRLGFSVSAVQAVTWIVWRRLHNITA